LRRFRRRSRRSGSGGGDDGLEGDHRILWPFSQRRVTVTDFDQRTGMDQHGGQGGKVNGLYAQVHVETIRRRRNDRNSIDTWRTLGKGESRLA